MTLAVRGSLVRGSLLAEQDEIPPHLSLPPFVVDRTDWKKLPQQFWTYDRRRTDA